MARVRKLSSEEIDEIEELEDDLDEEEEGEPQAGWADALQEQFGSVPWWVISTVIHIVVLALLSLIYVAEPPLETTDTIIPMELAEQPEIMPEEKIHDVFKSDRTIPLPDQVDHPVIVHEEPEEFDHMETENNMDNNTARGQEDAISDIPLGGTGVVGNLGVGGGGGGCFGFRTGGGRRRAALRGGGSAATENAVDRALEWLWRHQEKDGRWDGERKYEIEDTGRNTDVGTTGLALLAFLGAGHTEKHADPAKFRDTVKKAVAYLIRVQKADGSIGHGLEGGLGYHHSIAGLALAEAYGMAKVPRTGQAAQKAIDYSLGIHQVEYSGWRYNPKQPGDLSVTGWFVMQIKSGTIAGLKVDGKGFQGASAFLDTVAKSGAGLSGLCAYKPERSYTPTMTAVGMLCRQFMGMKRENPLLQGAGNYLLQNLPEWNPGMVNFYYWYYGTLVMFQMGGDWWKAWNATLRDMLTERQRRGPPKIDGSWDTEGMWCGTGGGRAYATATCCLCLEVYYRYLPLYQAGN